MSPGNQSCDYLALLDNASGFAVRITVKKQLCWAGMRGALGDPGFDGISGAPGDNGLQGLPGNLGFDGNPGPKVKTPDLISTPLT